MIYIEVARMDHNPQNTSKPY